MKLNPAPPVPKADDASKRNLANVPIDAMTLPSFGPENPFTKQKLAQNGIVALYEEHEMNLIDFDDQVRRYNRANMQNKLYLQQDSISNVPHITQHIKVNEKAQKHKQTDPSILEGPNKYRGTWMGSSEEEEDPVGIDYEDEIKIEETSVSKLITPGDEKTIFHCPESKDYQNRTYMHHTNSTEPPLECFIPKRCVFTYRGHTKGVYAIKLFPRSAHLILSASMDTKVKLWSVYGERRALRTYIGHNKPVRDISFDSMGQKFVSASYDKYLKIWDTETGQCIRSFTTGKIPFCVQFHPDVDKKDIFLTGQQDKKIYQFDIRVPEPTQEYNQHLGPVNSITFIDNNRRFVSSSDDKSMRAWDFDIPVVIKYVAEPNMHSMPCMALSPNKRWLAGQSLDNQIVLFSTTDRLRVNRKKVFRGHIVAGYSCQINFSPDNRFLISGDSTGNMHYWDFKSTKILKKQKVHENVVTGCIWHPYETSKVFTCSWDNTIKLWD